MCRILGIPELVTEFFTKALQNWVLCFDLRRVRFVSDTNDFLAQQFDLSSKFSLAWCDNGGNVYCGSSRKPLGKARPMLVPT